MAKNMSNAELAAKSLEMGGASKDTISRTVELTGLDDAANHLYADGLGESPASPVHRLTWRSADLGEFETAAIEHDPAFAAVVEASIAALRKCREEGTEYGADGKVSELCMGELGKAGWWGARVPNEFGGSEASAVEVNRAITDICAAGFGEEAGLQSVHGFIGVVGPLKIFGKGKLKERLRLLASGARTSFFALTEPGAGSDLSAVRTTAKRVGDSWELTGEKVFITNAFYGRMGCVVAQVEGEVDEKTGRLNKAVFVVDLPDHDTETFRINRYGLYPLEHVHNNGLIFSKFVIPAENRLTGPEINGMLAAYHGLNFGRAAVCANAAGAVRQILRSITPKGWGAFRQTYGLPIEERELVTVRIARMAALIVMLDAVRDWASSKLDEGYRGELENTIAKVMGSWALEEAAVKHGFLTHGGRGLRKGNIIGDRMFDSLAPLIYEGENHMLLMKYFLELFGEHGKRFMLPLGDSLADVLKGFKALGKDKVLDGIKKIPSGLFGLVRHGVPFGLWGLWALVRAASSSAQTPEGMDKRLIAHIKFAVREARKLAVQGTYYMVKHQAAMEKRQNRMVDLSKLGLWTITIIVTALHAHKSANKTTIDAADVMCQVLAQQIRPHHFGDAFYASAHALGQAVVAGEFQELEGVMESPIVHPYAQ